jgi:pyruvate formate lyase activating enzyme
MHVEPPEQTMSRGSVGLIYDVQRFSVHDGPGIRTTVFFKGCPLRCAWCHNPESLRSVVEVALRAERCGADDHCVAACPQAAIAPARSGRPAEERIERRRCAACGRCTRACPFGALELVGRRATVEELSRDLVRDHPFFLASGGGVTLSGGEPTLQLEFVAALARTLREATISVVLQTCGAFDWASFTAVLPLLELIQFDLKVMDPTDHRRLCGADNGPILANARRLHDAQAPVAFRMPVIPDLTDGDENLHAVARFLWDLGVPTLQLMRYHAMGETKLARLGWPRPPLTVATACADERLAHAAATLRTLGLEVTI